MAQAGLESRQFGSKAHAFHQTILPFRGKKKKELRLRERQSWPEAGKWTKKKRGKSKCPLQEWCQDLAWGTWGCWAAGGSPHWAAASSELLKALLWPAELSSELPTSPRPRALSFSYTLSHSHPYMHIHTHAHWMHVCTHGPQSMPWSLRRTVIKTASSNSSEGESNTLKKRVCWFRAKGR